LRELYGASDRQVKAAGGRRSLEVQTRTAAAARALEAVCKVLTDQA
jgi:hypothetical protein